MYETDRERVDRAAGLWENELGLDWLEITHNFDEHFREDAVVAETDVMWQYRRAVVTWNLPSVTRMSDKSLENIALHELVHVLMGPLKEELSDSPYVSNLEEFTVESITRAIQNMKRGHQNAIDIARAMPSKLRSV